MQNQTLKTASINDMLLEICHRLKIDPLKIDQRSAKSRPDTYNFNDLTNDKVLVFSFPEHNIDRIKYAAQYRRIPYAKVGNTLYVSRNQSAIDAEKVLGRKMFHGLEAGKSIIVPVHSLKAKERITREIRGTSCDIMLISNEAHIYMRRPHEAPLDIDYLREFARENGLIGMPQFNNKRVYWTHAKEHKIADNGRTIEI